MLHDCRRIINNNIIKHKAPCKTVEFTLQILAAILLQLLLFLTLTAQKIHWPIFLDSWSNTKGCFKSIVLTTSWHDASPAPKYFVSEFQVTLTDYSEYLFDKIKIDCFISPVLFYFVASWKGYNYIG